MPEAYEVGITLALQNGVSAGIQLIQRDLALLDRAIAATSQNLVALEAKVGNSSKSALALPVSPTATTEGDLGKGKTDGASAGDSADDGVSAGALARAPAVGSAQESLPTAAFGATSGHADDSGAKSGPKSSFDQRPAASLEQAAPAVAHTGPIASSSNGFAGGEMTSNANDAAPRQPLVASAPVETAATIVVPSPQRRIGPILPSSLDAGPTTSASPASPPPQPRQEPAPQPGKAISAAPVEEARAPSSQSGAGETADLAPLISSQIRAVAAPPESRRTQAPDTSAWTSKRPDRQIDSAVPVPHSPSGGAPNAEERKSSSPRGPGRADERPQQSSAAAPSAANSQNVTLQGDIIIDGTRLGRWMTNSLARQASRPPSGPVAPDPRQTPLWSGQAQGF